MVIVIAILFKRATNFRNDAWLKTFGVVVGDRLLNVPGRILQTPDIIYGQVGVSSLDLSSVSNAFVTGYGSYLSKSKTRELEVLIQEKFHDM